MSIFRSALTLTLAACMAIPLPAAGEGALVNGQVKGRQGDPKQFVSVSLEGPGRYAALTNEQGAFAIQNVTPGKYRVKVRQGDQVEEFSRDVGGGRVDLVVKW